MLRDWSGSPVWVPEGLAIHSMRPERLVDGDVDGGTVSLRGWRVRLICCCGHVSLRDRWLLFLRLGYRGGESHDVAFWLRAVDSFGTGKESAGID
jgi:hypothetical protein